MERRNAWETYDEKQIGQLEAVCRRYRAYLDAGKTERECAAETIRLAKEAGYRSLSEAIEMGEKLKPSDKLYCDQMGKSVLLFVLGNEKLEKGMNIIGAHIDSPRMDIKQNPLYEDTDLAYLDTHYYGGIKKYQWVTLPLALHGVVAKKDGTVVHIVVGEKDDDPVFAVSDLLIHLAQDQMQKKASVVIEGEELNLLVGGKPVAGEEKDKVKAGVLAFLKEAYDIEEEDFLSAELEVVPAGRCRELGFDRSMLLGYGHDDRVCAFAQVEAMLGLEGVPERTSCCILADKEEIGSVGATGMQSRFFENSLAELMALCGEEGDLKLRRALKNSRMLSCDVSAGFDPNFASVFEKKNAAFLGRGVCFNKFTGARGKSGSNDANAEFLGRLRRTMDDAGVNFQTAELGKVDVGGGGTIAYICALYGMDVIDSGVPVLSMHAPWEIVNKADVYEAAKAYKAFLVD
ncbi:MAG: aminopeptidase [Candidatus Aphodomonas sp.]|nr:aminopeptidase [Candidatus Aphodomonas sp.]